MHDDLASIIRQALDTGRRVREARADAVLTEMERSLTLLDNFMVGPHCSLSACRARSGYAIAIGLSHCNGVMPACHVNGRRGHLTACSR